MKKWKNLIVGAGITGSILARKIADELREEVLIIDRKPHIAGNCFDYKDDNGITIQWYGPHIFHTNNDEVWGYLSRFTDWHTYCHKVCAYIDDDLIPIPFNFTSIEKSFPDNIASNIKKYLLETYGEDTSISILELKKQENEYLKILANYVYEKVFLNYSVKQWGVSPEDIDESVLARVPVNIGYDDNYFKDKYQGIPKSGYTNLIKNILDNELITSKISIEFKEHNFEYERLFYTGPIDEFFDYKFGTLPYRSLTFNMETHDKEFYQNRAVINYPNDNNYTRITEFKHFLDEKSEKTHIVKEVPSEFKIGENSRYYPVLNDSNTGLYNKYLDEAKKLENTYFAGRLGDYKYYNMDKAIERAFELFNEITQ